MLACRSTRWRAETGEATPGNVVSHGVGRADQVDHDVRLPAPPGRQRHPRQVAAVNGCHMKLVVEERQLLSRHVNAGYRSPAPRGHLHHMHPDTASGSDNQDPGTGDNARTPGYVDWRSHRVGHDSGLDRVHIRRQSDNVPIWEGDTLGEPAVPVDPDDPSQRKAHRLFVPQASRTPAAKQVEMSRHQSARQLWIRPWADGIHHADNLVPGDNRQDLRPVAEIASNAVTRGQPHPAGHYAEPSLSRLCDRIGNDSGLRHPTPVTKDQRVHGSPSPSPGQEAATMP